jgi:spore germination cell wall hydrolase CwlJ-like protein
MKTIGWITVSCLVIMAYSKINLSYGEEPEVNDEVELTWLAKNVYFEARNQGVAGQ